jgi:hypothetical protein
VRQFANYEIVMFNLIKTIRQKRYKNREKTITTTATVKVFVPKVSITSIQWNYNIKGMS